MMKKFLVLALVLSVASLASAALVETALTPGLKAVADTTAKTITFVATAAASGDATSVTLASFNIQLNAAGTMGYVSGVATLNEGFSEYLGNDWAGWVMNTSTNGAVGTLAVFSYTGAATKATLYNDDDAGASEVWFRSSPMVGLGGKEISLVPEPATMALLGLGALVLRRKK